MMHLSREYKHRITSTFGEEGVRWIQSLPSTLESISHHWSLTLLTPFDNLSYNYVTSVLRKDGSKAVLKTGVPNKELTTEIEALRLLDGRGTVQLLESDHELGALLLEYLRPGQPLFENEEDEIATTIAAQTMEKLWITPLGDHVFPSVGDWAKGFQRLRDCFEGGTGPFSHDQVEVAASIFKDLIDTSSDPVLLHGDLHHWNILSAEREPWLAIDPKGVIGEPEYEVGAWLRNPFPHILRFENPRQIISRRVRQFCEILGFDRDRLLGWGFAQVVLAGWWAYEDNGDDLNDWINLAGLMAKMI
jgi:streptomycin 6-kinase